MKIVIDKDFVGSASGVLRLGTVGLGGAVFGTLAQNGLLLRPTSHVLMWVSVFAWIMSLISYLANVYSVSLFRGKGEWSLNFLISILYVTATVLYGVWDIVPGGSFSGMGLLVFIYAALNFFLYLVLSLVQLCGNSSGKMSTARNGSQHADAVV